MNDEGRYQAPDTPRDCGSARWYPVRTKPRQEELALTNLENQGFTCYLPHIWIGRRVGGQWRHVREVLFPGYLFIHVDTNAQDISPVRSTLGVTGLVRFGPLLRAIDDSVIDFIRQQELATNPDSESPAPRFRVGDSVEILEGPLAGLSAVFKMAKSADRLLVLVRILGAETPVAVDINSIAPR